MLGFQSNGQQLGLLSLTAAFQDEGSLGVVTVVPRCFEQESPYMDIASLGDGAWNPRRAAGTVWSVRQSRRDAVPGRAGGRRMIRRRHSQGGFNGHTVF